jgi:hypothetical protein
MFAPPISKQAIISMQMWMSRLKTDSNFLIAEYERIKQEMVNLKEKIDRSVKN